MEPFGTVLIVVALVAIVVAGLSYIGSGAIYGRLGRTGMSLHAAPNGPPHRPGAADAALEDEVRQPVVAGSERRERRGQAVETEVEWRLKELGAQPTQIGYM